MASVLEALPNRQQAAIAFSTFTYVSSSKKSKKFYLKH